MKKVLAFTALLLTTAYPLAFAQSGSAVGTWKFDAAQSDFGSMPKPKSMTLFITKDTPQMLAWHLNGTTQDGKAMHESWSGPQDGSMQPLRRTGGNGQASFQNNNGTFTIHEKMANGETADSTAENDGNTMTEHVTGTTENGQPFTETIVWHKVVHKKTRDDVNRGVQPRSKIPALQLNRGLSLSKTYSSALNSPVQPSSTHSKTSETDR